MKVKLDEVLKSKGRTKYWLGKQTGITQQNIGRLVNGKTKSVKFENIDAICTALECEVGDIFESEEYKRD